MDVAVSHRRALTNEESVHTRLVAKFYQCFGKGIRDILNMHIRQSTIGLTR